MKPKDLGLPTEAYISVEEIHDVSNHGLYGRHMKMLAPCLFCHFLNVALISISAIVNAKPVIRLVYLIVD